MFYEKKIVVCGLVCSFTVPVRDRFNGLRAMVDIVVELIELQLDDVGLVVFIVVVQLFLVEFQFLILRSGALHGGDKQICRSVCDWRKLDDEAFVYCDGQRFDYLE